MCQRYVYRVLLQAGRLRPRQRHAEKLAGPAGAPPRHRPPARGQSRGRGPAAGRKPARAVRPYAEDRLALQEALARLSPEEAELIRLQYFEGYTPKEIADRLGLPLRDGEKKRRQRALARLRKSLLATLILVLLALLAACGYAVLRYFGILPGYGVNTDAETPFYIWPGKRPAKTTWPRWRSPTPCSRTGSFRCRSC